MTETIQSCREYLEHLRSELAGADPALVQDALNDAQDFIYGERANPELADADESTLVARLLESFGSPEEVAEAYLETERVVSAALATQRVAPMRDRTQTNPAVPEQAAPPVPTHSYSRSHTHSRAGILSIFMDPRAYSSAFFMLLALPTGIILFTWAVTGFALSLGFSVLIIGFPFLLFFLATTRVLSLVEGRMVESLLGERMPRRATPAAPNGPWIQRVKFWVTDMRTWSTLAYMLLRLPTGILAFTVLTVFLALVAGLLAGPFVSMVLDQPFITIDEFEIYGEVWMIPIGWILGAAVSLLTLHVCSWTGRVLAAVAKSMLVRI